MRLLLLSNAADHGREPLEHAHDVLASCLDGAKTVTFVGFAQRDLEAYTERVSAAFEPLGVTVKGLHRADDMQHDIGRADCLYVGGGNTFRLLKALQELKLVDVIRERVRGGVPYVGDSAGSIVPCPTIRTSNDMPVVEPRSFDALGLVPFQINPHYITGVADESFMGETRDERIADYLAEVGLPVLALREGSWLYVDGPRAELGGVAGARLFRAGHDVREIDPAADLSWLVPVGASVRADRS